MASPDDIAVFAGGKEWLLVSSLHLGQPRGIANLGFVTDWLSY
jgi:hypothetical protein